MPGFLSASRRRVLPPPPAARHLPGLAKTIQLLQINRLAARWSLGRGNTLVPSSVNNSRLGLIAPGGLRGRRDQTRG